MKIVTVVGARPQFIKAAVVSREIKKRNNISEMIIHTGQHYDSNMSDIFFQEMHISLPDYFLGIGGKSHGAMTGQMLEKIEEVLLKEKPDCVLVFGDTNSTLAGALAASKLHIPVGHVEAGLRSFNMKMPEEINRLLTDRISKWLFCPTETSVQNLKNEGFNNATLSTNNYQLINNVGDVMYDAALYYRDIAVPSDAVRKLIDELKNDFYLATIHRAENTDDPEKLTSVLSALNEISQETPVILPIHPRTNKIICQFNSSLFTHHASFIIIPPVSYFDMLTLLSACAGVFTDSGGVQKEAYFFKKPCVTLRDETEWVELVENGYNILTGACCERILEAERVFIPKLQSFSNSFYGDGNAGEKIVDLLLNSINV